MAELAGAPVAAALLAGVLLAGAELAGVLGAEEPPEPQAASSAAAVTAIPGVSQYFRLSVIAITSADPLIGLDRSNRPI